MTRKATSFLRAAAATGAIAESVVLDSAERHLRRKLIAPQGGAPVLVDFPMAVRLEHGDCLVLDTGGLVRIVAAEEKLTEVRANDATHLATLAWHIGNRHLEAQIEPGRILIRHDHVIAGMLEQLGARVADVREKFSPQHGAYRSHVH